MNGIKVPDLEIKGKMKAVKRTQSIILVVIFGLIFSIGVLAQDEDDKVISNERAKIAKTDKTSDSDKPRSADKITRTEEKADDDDETNEAIKTEQYFNNYLAEYRLGPQDIISIEVFGQCPDYCKLDVLVPPTAKMSYPLIREGVFVGGKTVEEVADDVTKRLEEYIIDPKVTVSLVRPGSARYAVMGKVNSPGVRVMDRRISVNEAILDAGGIAKGGSRNKVFVARFNQDGFYDKQEIDLVGIENGKIPTIFLKPGDQIFVGEKGFTLSKFFDYLGKASAARILFGSPF